MHWQGGKLAVSFPLLNAIGFTGLEDSSFFTCSPLDDTIKYEAAGGFVVSRPRYTRSSNITITTGFSDLNESDKEILDRFFQNNGQWNPFQYILPTGSSTQTIATISRIANVATIVLTNYPIVPLNQFQSVIVSGVTVDPTFNTSTPVAMAVTVGGYQFSYPSVGPNLAATAVTAGSVFIQTIYTVKFDDVYKPKYMGAGTTFRWQIPDIKLRTV